MKELYAKCAVYLPMWPDENEDDAIDRLYDMLTNIDIGFAIYTTEIREED